MMAKLSFFVVSELLHLPFRLVYAGLVPIQFTLIVTAFSVPSPDINVSTPSKRINSDIVMDFSDSLFLTYA